MNQSQVSICEICKQEIDLDEAGTGVINCKECHSLYHSEHLEIWLRLENDCLHQCIPGVN